MDAISVSRQGNGLQRLQINFKVAVSPEKKFVKCQSTEYICGAFFFQIELNTARCCSAEGSYVDLHCLINVKFRIIFKELASHIICKLSSTKCGLKDLTFSADNTWHKIYHYSEENFTLTDDHKIFRYTFDVSIACDIAESTRPFALLYDDTDLVDFELHGKGGTIGVHRAVLAASSPVFKTMLCGDWKESKEGKVAVSGCTMESLQQFKNYIYLHKLPETDIESLLTLGSYYMMSELVQKCVAKLMNKLDPGNVIELIELAVKFKLDNLLMYILKCVKNDVISIEQIEAIHFLHKASNDASNENLNLVKE